jgi:CPA1 family monovalent cation:H+ antiporter
MHVEIAIVALFAVATAVAIAARWLKVPYTVALVVTGLLLGSLHLFEPPHLTKELLYAVFLPGLVFEAAFHLEFKKFWQNKIAIHSLAIPGVIVALVVSAVVLTPLIGMLGLAEGFTLQYGLVFGAIIVATDPIAVVSLFKSLGAPKRLGVLVEGESLLNDGTGVVLFTLILGIVVSGDFSLSMAIVDFFRVVGLGMLIGALFGYVVSKVTQQIDDPMIEITLTTIAAYGSFVVAEHFHFSGVIATVVAGMLAGNYGARTGMSATTRVSVETFWEYLAFALNSLVFLLIGFEVKLKSLVESWHFILLAFIASLLGRALVVFLISLFLKTTKEKLPWSWSAVMVWGGLRGGLSMVLALGLPLGFPFRDLLITMTFGVVIVSILVQGLTMPILLQRLGLLKTSTERHVYEQKRGELRAINAALRELDKMSEQRFADEKVLQEAKAEYQVRLKKVEEELSTLHLSKNDLRQEELESTHRHLLTFEKSQIMRDVRDGILEPEAAEHLLQQINEKLMQLEETHGEEAPAPQPEPQPKAQPERKPEEEAPEPKSEPEKPST